MLCLGNSLTETCRWHPVISNLWQSLNAAPSQWDDTFPNWTAFPGKKLQCQKIPEHDLARPTFQEPWILKNEALLMRVWFFYFASNMTMVRYVQLKIWGCHSGYFHDRIILLLLAKWVDTDQIYFCPETWRTKTHKTKSKIYKTIVSIHRHQELQDSDPWDGKQMRWDLKLPQISALRELPACDVGTEESR